MLSFLLANHRFVGMISPLNIGSEIDRLRLAFLQL